MPPGSGRLLAATVALLLLLVSTVPGRAAAIRLPIRTRRRHRERACGRHRLLRLRRGDRARRPRALCGATGGCRSREQELRALREEVCEAFDVRQTRGGHLLPHHGQGHDVQGHEGRGALHSRQGTVGACRSCCDACAASGDGPSCQPSMTTTTTTLTATTLPACGPVVGFFCTCPGVLSCGALCLDGGSTSCQDSRTYCADSCVSNGGDPADCSSAPCVDCATGEPCATTTTTTTSTTLPSTPMCCTFRPFRRFCSWSTTCTGVPGAPAHFGPPGSVCDGQSGDCIVPPPPPQAGDCCQAPPSSGQGCLSGPDSSTPCFHSGGTSTTGVCTPSGCQ